MTLFEEAKNKKKNRPSREERLKEKDTKRSVNYKHFTDRTWGDCKNYDLSLNSGKLGIERCVELIVQLANED